MRHPVLRCRNVVGTGIQGRQTMTRADAIRILTAYRMELQTALDGDELNPVLDALDTAIQIMTKPGNAFFEYVEDKRRGYVVMDGG